MMDRIRVLHVTQAEGAGVTEYIKMIATKVDLERYEPILIGSTYYEKEREFFEDKGWKVYTVPMEREISLMKDLKSVVELRKLFKQIKPNIIHIHSSKAGILGRISAMRCRGKVIYNAHGWAFNMSIGSKKRKFYGLVERMLSYITDEIIVISEDEYNTALQEGIPKKKMQIIRNAIETKHNQEYHKETILQELGIPEEAYIIGICGRITEQKAPEVFLKVCSEVYKKIPNAYFVMIGDGDLKQSTCKQAEYLGISERLIITGWTNQPDKYISILDITLLTSKWEGFGLVLLQYMLYKKPVIAAKVGGIPEIVRKGITGELVEWDNIEEYTDKILKVHNNPREYDRMIENAYDMVQREYSLIQLVQAHDELYERILEGVLTRNSRQLVSEYVKNESENRETYL